MGRPYARASGKRRTSGVTSVPSFASSRWPLSRSGTTVGWRVGLRRDLLRLRVVLELLVQHVVGRVRERQVRVVVVVVRVPPTWSTCACELITTSICSGRTPSSSQVLQAGTRYPAASPGRHPRVPMPVSTRIIFPCDRKTSELIPIARYPSASVATQRSSSSGVALGNARVAGMNSVPSDTVRSSASPRSTSPRPYPSRSFRPTFPARPRPLCAAERPATFAAYRRANSRAASKGPCRCPIPYQPPRSASVGRQSPCHPERSEGSATRRTHERVADPSLPPMRTRRRECRHSRRRVLIPQGGPKAHVVLRMTATSFDWRPVPPPPTTLHTTESVPTIRSIRLPNPLTAPPGPAASRDFSPANDTAILCHVVGNIRHRHPNPF